MSNSSKLYGKVALLTLPLVTAVSTAYAQAPEQQASANGLEEIIVTARLRSESLQDVPMAIEAFNERALERLDVVRLSDVAAQTPNLTFVSGESGRLNTPVIRGMALIDSRGFDNNVGVFVDGVYVSGRAAQDVGLLDVQRIEVIKGPQSALYGRNTFAGAVNFVTKPPTQELSGNVEVTVGEDDLFRVQAAVSGALIPDVLAARLSIGSLDDEGTYENAGPAGKGDGIDGFDNTSVAGTLMFTPNESADIFLDLYYADEHRDSRALEIVPSNCGEIVPGRTSLSYDIGQPYYFCGELPSFGDDDLSLSPEAYSSDGITKRVSLRMDFAIGEYTLHSTSAYTDNESNGYADLDRSQVGGAHFGYAPRALYEALGSPPVTFPDAPFIPGFVPVTDANFNTYIGSQGLDQEYWEQEIRIDSPQDRKLRWSAGLFYFHSENGQSSDLDIDVSSAVDATGLQPDELVFFTVDPNGGGPLGRLALPHPLLGQQYEVSTNLWANGAGQAEQLTLSNEESEQFAVFASVEYDFTDTLTGTAELRYTDEERSLDDVKDDFFFTVVPGTNNYHEVKHDFFDPRFTLRWTPSDDLMVYGSAAHGTRSGGVNGNTGAVDTDILEFEPEENWTYEIGTKTSWFDDRLQLNAAIFYIDWTDAQFRQRLTDSLGSFLTATTNATGLTNKGVEFSFVARPIQNLRISGGYGFSDPEFDDDTLYSGGAALCALADPSTSAYQGLPIDCVADPAGSGDFFPDMSGLQPKRSSQHTANIDIQYSAPLGNNGMSWFVGGNSSYRSKQYMDEINVAYVPERIITNFNLGVDHENYSVTLWVKNAFDEDAPEFAQIFQTDFNSILPSATIVGIPKRRFGATARFRF
tara:strand:- start:19714 stop:22308 length:2595 start_codon:yes stop_codon:yes gene_type:complete